MTTDFRPAVRDVRDLAAKHYDMLAGMWPPNASPCPAASTLLLMAWREQIKLEAEARVAALPPDDGLMVVAAKKMAGHLADEITASHSREPMICQSPRGKVMAVTDQMVNAVPLWFHHFLYIRDVAQRMLEEETVVQRAIKKAAHGPTENPDTGGSGSGDNP